MDPFLTEFLKIEFPKFDSEIWKETLHWMRSQFSWMSMTCLFQTTIFILGVLESIIQQSKFSEKNSLLGIIHMIFRELLPWSPVLFKEPFLGRQSLLEQQKEPILRFGKQSRQWLANFLVIHILWFIGIAIIFQMLFVKLYVERRSRIGSIEWHFTGSY